MAFLTYFWQFLQIENLRKQAEDQEASLLAQEEEVHGKQKELDALKEEEKKLLEEIKASEKEIQKLSHDLDVSSEINTEVGPWSFQLLLCSPSTTGLALWFTLVCHNSDDKFKAFIV